MAVAQKVCVMGCFGVCCNISAHKLIKKFTVEQKLTNTAKRLLPLTKMSVCGRLNPSFSKVEIMLEYVNPSDKETCETFFDFPIDENVVIEGVEVCKDGRWINSIIVSDQDAVDQSGVASEAG